MIVTFIAMAAGGVVLGVVGRMARLGDLKPNRWAGIRTPYTYSSDEAWYSTHRHAGVILERAGFGVAVASVFALAPSLMGVFSEAYQAIGAFLLAAVVLAAALAAWLIGTSRAKRDLAG